MDRITLVAAAKGRAKTRMASHFRRLQTARTLSSPAPFFGSLSTSSVLGTQSWAVGGAPLRAESGILDLVEQGPVAGLQQPGRANAVPVRLLERLQDRAPLGRLRGLPGDLLERDRRRLGSARRGACPRRSAPRRQRDFSSGAGRRARSMRLIMFSSSRTLPGKLCRSQALHRLGRQREALALEGLRVALDEVVGEERDLLGALAERGHPDPDDVQPVEEVLAELLGRHRALEVLVGRRDDPHVDLDVRPAADTRELAVFQDVEELGLKGRVEVADLVEEDRPLFAASNLPILSWCAPVKAPRSWPNSSLSSSSRATAAQLTLTNGPVAGERRGNGSPAPRAPCRCRSRP